jgi:Lon protease-like protein
MVPDTLPLFPLPRLVLFPHTFVPLHIFEPRYRQMTSEILASHHHLAMVLAKQEPETDLLPGTAPTFEVCTLARVVRAEPLADGRWNLLVQGRRAARVLAEVEGKPYRQARLEEVPFDGETPLESHLRGALLRSLHGFSSRFELMPQIKQLLDLQLSDEVLLNTLAMALEFEPVEKQFLLEARSLGDLAERLHQLLDFAAQDRGLPEEEA